MLTKTNGEKAPALHYDPFAEFTKTREAMNSLFEFVLRPASFVPFAFEQYPEMNLYEEDGKYFIECALPGFRREDIDIQVTDRGLTVKAKAEQVESKGGRRYVINELRQRSYTRSLTFPEIVDPKTVEARLEHGILKITVPMPLGVRPEKVLVKG